MLIINKSASVSNTTVGSIITYTLEVTNSGPNNLFDVSVSDVLSSSLKFVSGSVKINGLSNPLDSILSGVYLGTLNATVSSTITFDAEVVSQPANKQITNTSVGEYSYVDPETHTVKFGSVNSDTVTVTVNVVNLTLKKAADKKTVSIGDTVTYTVTLTNTGDTNLVNVQFMDEMAPGLQLINGTFTINGVVINNVNLATGVVIPSIPVNTTVTIVYKAKVISTNNCNATNVASATYKYILPDGTSGSGSSCVTPDSTVTLKTNMSNFKQLSVEDYIQIPHQKPNIEAINSVDGKIDIVKYSIVKTGPSTSMEGQILTNYKLVIQGVLHLVVEYTACNPAQDVHSAHFSIPFSTFIVLPINFVPGCKIDVSGLIEDIYAKEMDCRKLFVNTTILVTANI